MKFENNSHGHCGGNNIARDIGMHLIPKVDFDNNGCPKGIIRRLSS